MINLKDAIQDGVVSDLDRFDPALVLPLKSFLVMRKGETGRHRNHFFKRKDMKFVFLKNFANQPVLVGIPRKSMPVKLYGRTGLENGSKLFQKIADKLFSSKKYGIKATPLSLEDTKLLLGNLFFMGFERPVWIDEEFDEKVGAYHRHGYKYAIRDEIKDIEKTIIVSDHQTNSTVRIQENNFAVELWLMNPEKIMIEKVDRVWKMYPEDKLWLLKFIFR